MIHRMFRSLDDPPKLVGFTVKQWIALIAGTVALVAFIRVASVPTRPAITLAVFVIGLPAALGYVSESGGLQLSVLLRSMCRWRTRQHMLPAADSAGWVPRRLVVVRQGQEQVEAPDEDESSGEVDGTLAWERWG